MNDRFRCRLRREILVMVAGLCAGGAEAADAEPTSRPPHQLSPELRAAITESLPKYAPPAPAKINGATAGESDGGSDGILALPKMTVHAQRLPPLTSYEFLTLKGRLALAKRLFPAAGAAIGLAMLAEKIDLEKKQALSDLLKGTSVLDTAEDRATAKEMKKALPRPNTDWASHFGGQSGNVGH